MNVNLLEFMNAILLPYNAQKIVIQHEINDCTKQQFFADKTLFIKTKQDCQDSAQFFLALFVNLAYDKAKKMSEQGISDRIIFDTFFDISIWCDFFKKQNGDWGLGELDWLTNHILGKLVRLGRLQFIATTLKKDIMLGEQKISKGSVAFEVHIPAGEPLSIEACRSSYRQAQDFFKMNQIVLLCDSWLLSPVLDKIIEPHSNIAAFKSDYTIISFDKENRSAERYVFGKIGDPKHYPQDTSLQKRIKEFLLSGEFVGSALGVYKIN